MIKKWTCIMLTILLMVSLGFPTAFAADVETEDSNKMSSLDRLSQEVVILTEKGQFAQAKGKLDQLAEIFTGLGTEKRISIEALELASSTIVQGKMALADVTPDTKKIHWHVTRIRILIDALTHTNQPLWKSYYTTYLEQVSKMHHQAGRSKQEDLRNTLEQNYQLYITIKPAIALHHSPSTVQMLDSIYSFLTQQSHSEVVQWEAVQQTLEQLREYAGNIFLGKEQNTFSWYISSNSPVVMISIMCLILVTVLSYSAWRMYRGERMGV